MKTKDQSQDKQKYGSKTHMMILQSLIFLILQLFDYLSHLDW